MYWPWHRNMKVGLADGAWVVSAVWGLVLCNLYTAFQAKMIPTFKKKRIFHPGKLRVRGDVLKGKVSKKRVFSSSPRMLQSS